MQNKKAAVVVIPFFLFLISFLLLSISDKDETYSRVENRSLMQLPKITGAKMDQITKDFDTFVVDQFPGRSTLLKLFSMSELAQNKKQSRGTYIADSRWLMTKTYPLSTWQVRNFTDALKGIAEKNAGVSNEPTRFYYAIIPIKNYALSFIDSDYIVDKNSDTNRSLLASSMEGLDSIKTIDVAANFIDNFTEDQLESLYFRSDFHWNAKGAYEAANLIQKHFAHEGTISESDMFVPEDFDWITLDHASYQGDLNRRFSNLFPMNEEIPIISLKNQEGLTYYLSVDDSQPADRADIIGKNTQNTSLTYNDIYTDNIALYKAHNINAPSDKTLIIFKDSLENPMTDFFSAVFREVIVIDARFNVPVDMTGLLESKEDSVILFMFHQNNASAELISYLTK